jgi:hypothetical protein
MARIHIALSLLLPLLFRTAQAADVPGPFQPLSVSALQVPSGPTEPDYRIIVVAGTNRFAFMLPKGFRCEGDPSTGKLRINKIEVGAFINFGLAVNPAKPDKSALLSRYPAGRTVAEFDRPVLGCRCHVLDIEWATYQKFRELTRIVHVSTKAGILEISITAGVREFPEGERALNILLNTLTDGQSPTQNAPVGAPISS